MSPSLLIIVPCGQAKIWKREPNHGPAKAKNAYIGAPFKVNKAFAEKFGDRWIILSAKYGFIDPNFIVRENYNVTFKKPSTNPVSMKTLKKQLREKNLYGYDIVVSLGGKDYSKIVREVFRNMSKVAVPTEGLPIGKAMKQVKTLLGLERTELCVQMHTKF